MPDFLLPFGPFHMVILHLPIGALAAIWFVEILLENNAQKPKDKTLGLLHLFLLISTGLTIALGLAYADYGKYGDEIEAHEFWGYVFGGCILLTYLLYWAHRLLMRRGSKLLYMLSLLAATITMVIAGHQGAELIHGKGFLSKPFKTETRRTVTPPIETEPAPTSSVVPKEVSVQPSTPKETPPTTVADVDEQADPMDPMAAVAHPPKVAASDVALFEATQAIFKRHCYNCHGATKQKGDYRLDNKHSIYLGGKSDLPAVVPGDAEESELMYRMLLPRDDDDVMPPEEKEAVSAADLETVRQWIEAGAYWPDESELSSAPGEYVKIGDADTDTLIEQINSTGVKAEYNAWGDGSVRIDLGVVDEGQLNTALSQLNQFGSKLTWLDCSGLTLTGSFFKELQRQQQIDRLHLDSTNINDEQLKALTQLPKLSYLNLYNTEISDAGLATLQACPNLQKVFLSQTKVSTEGITKLQTACPNLEVVYQP